MINNLYNVMFPIWFLLIFPYTWFIVLPANFIIDSGVILLSYKNKKEENIKSKYSKSIFWIWGLGFLADIIGGAILLALQNISNPIFNEYISTPLNFNPLDNWYSFFFMLFIIAISGLMIFIFNYLLSFRKIGIDNKKKKHYSLILAIFTAPYVFLFPSQIAYTSTQNIYFFTNHIVHNYIDIFSVNRISDNVTQIYDDEIYDTNFNYGDISVLKTAINNAKRVYNYNEEINPEFNLNISYKNNNFKPTSIYVWSDDSKYYFMYNNRNYLVNNSDTEEFKDSLIDIFK